MAFRARAPSAAADTIGRITPDLVPHRQVEAHPLVGAPVDWYTGFMICSWHKCSPFYLALPTPPRRGRYAQPADCAGT